ncbi:MAG: sugar phosphate isomerase/epimerase [Gemmataceae bacterium]|nr:sugar phosphate isomerase/epimerase [Gemmataceae bacterium]
MRLGFVSALLPELSLEEVFGLARDEGYSCVELMCWPVGKADRRYAGVTHLDVGSLDDNAASRVHGLVRKTGVGISGLGYYPNPLAPDAEHRNKVAEHLARVIGAAARLGLGVVNTFIGRDAAKPIDAQWDAVREVFGPLVGQAAKAGVRIGIEHCPMLFSENEWPGGHNLAISPAVWRRLFSMFPGGTLGLNLDPSHLAWQMIDAPRAIREFKDRIVHVHAKDARIDEDRLYELGVTGLMWHTPKLPGMGDVAWGPFFSALTDAGYKGPVCVEVEDRAFEGTLEDRVRSLRVSRNFLRQWVAG